VLTVSLTHPLVQSPSVIQNIIFSAANSIVWLLAVVVYDQRWFIIQVGFINVGNMCTNKLT